MQLRSRRFPGDVSPGAAPAPAPWRRSWVQLDCFSFLRLEDTFLSQGKRPFQGLLGGGGPAPRGGRRGGGGRGAEAPPGAREWLRPQPAGARPARSRVRGPPPALTLPLPWPQAGEAPGLGEWGARDVPTDLAAPLPLQTAGPPCLPLWLEAPCQYLPNWPFSGWDKRGLPPHFWL